MGARRLSNERPTPISAGGWAPLAIALLLAALPAGAATAQVGFSPEGSARVLVLQVIEGAQRQIRMLAYTFSARDIVQALLSAQRRGVDVRLVVDEGEARKRSSRAALDTLADAGIAVRLDGRYRLQHDKTMVADGKTVQTGSFNYTWAAERDNSENALVVWDEPALAGAFLRHWQSRWNQSTAYQASH